MKEKLFEIGEYDYSDLDERLTKPVKLTEKDLKNLAENYRGGIPLTKEHKNIYLGIGNNISYDENEGKLFMEVPDDLDMTGKGLSPRLDVFLQDDGDTFKINNMKMIDVGITESPRRVMLLNSQITDESENTDTNVATSLLIEKLQGKNAEITKLHEEISNLKEESKQFSEIKKAIEKNKDFIDNKEDILKELSELRKAESERKIKEYEEKYNFNYNENTQDKETIDKLLSGDVDMELMEKLAERRIKIEAANDEHTPGGRNPQNSETNIERKENDENKPSFTNREEYNQILKELGFNRTKI